MSFARFYAGNWPMLAVVALCALSQTSAAPVRPVDQAWPVLLSIEPAEINAEFALLQMRANVSLAKLIESAGVRVSGANGLSTIAEDAQ
jgi:hypothetical protein